MSVLTVGAHTVPVSRSNVSHEDLSDTRRAFSTKLRTSVSTERGHARVWSFTIAEMDRTDAEALIDDLIAPGFIDASGPVIIPSGSVSVRARSVSRTDTVNLDDVILSFELVEVL